MKALFGEHKFMVGVISAGFAAKVCYAALTPFSLDFLGWAGMGLSVLSGTFLGIYTGPSLFFALTFGVWNTITHDPAVMGPSFPGGGELLSAYYGVPGVPVTVRPEFFLFSLVMKAPAMVVDAVITLLIVKTTRALTNSKLKALTAAALWSTSPLVFLLENWSVVDTYLALLILAGSYALHRSKTSLSGLLFGIGTTLRLGPLFILPVQAWALVRNRRFKALTRFAAAQIAVLSLGAGLMVTIQGPSVIAKFLGERPGILIAEILEPIGPYLSPNISYNPYPLGLGTIAYCLTAIYLTRPSVWQNRNFGEEALAMFSAYFALAGFHPSFLLWILPLLAVFTVARGFGSRRFLLVTLSALFFFLVQHSRGIFAFGRGVLFIPSLNETMASVSGQLYKMEFMPIVPWILRSIFSATLLVALFWLMKSWRSATQIELSDR